MSGNSSYEMQAAIRQRLLMTPELTVLVGDRIYDRAPDHCPTPYVQFGGDEYTPFRAQGMRGSNLFITIHTWADSQRASAEVKRMNKAIEDALDDQRFPVQGHVIQVLSFVRSRNLDDPDGISRHGVNEFRCTTLPVG